MIRITRPGDGVALVTIDRPASRNAMTFAMWDTLRDAARALDAREDVRVVVVTGAGVEAFVAGTDIAEFGNVRGADDGLVYEARVEEAIAALETIRVPVIAAIDGACTGGGVSIAATCDVRIGGPGVRIGIPIARTLGNCISSRNLARVAERIGLDAAVVLLLTARLIDATSALRIGFLHEIAPEGVTALEHALASARQLATLAPLTLRASKEMGRRLRARARGGDDEDLIRACYGSEDFRNGVAAFVAKRSASWSGR